MLNIIILILTSMTLGGLVSGCAHGTNKAQSAPIVDYPLLVIDKKEVESGDTTNSFPPNFRTSWFIPARPSGKKIKSKGLRELKISGSAQISASTLKAMQKRFGGKLTVVDLRAESHGFIDGEPVSWFLEKNWGNKDLSHEEALAEESRLIQGLSKSNTTEVHDLQAIKSGKGVPVAKIQFTKVETEESLVRSSGASYLRFTVSDHVRPGDSEVARFVSAVQSLPSDSWLHFHCRAGRGRTTTFMAMYDMLHNASHLSLDEIVGRQAALGHDFDVLSVESGNNWKIPLQKERAAFVRAFYDYAKATQGGRAMGWLEWVKAHPVTAGP